MINEKILQESIIAFDLNSDDKLLNRRVSLILEFLSSTSLRCLHDKHRIIATKDYLFLNDK